jgi:hypothetical protein
MWSQGTASFKIQKSEKKSKRSRNLPPQILPKSQIQDENNQVIDDQDLKTRKSYLVQRLETGFNLPMLFYSGNNYNITKGDFLLNQEILQAIEIVNLSNILINQMRFGHDGTFHSLEHDPLIIQRLKLNDQDLEKINILVRESLQKAEKFLQLVNS